jgi:hypothetical protein
MASEQSRSEVQPGASHPIGRAGAGAGPGLVLGLGLGLAQARRIPGQWAAAGLGGAWRRGGNRIGVAAGPAPRRVCPGWREKRRIERRESGATLKQKRRRVRSRV